MGLGNGRLNNVHRDLSRRTSWNLEGTNVHGESDTGDLKSQTLTPRCPASLSGGMAQPLRSGRGPIGPAMVPKSR